MASMKRPRLKTVKAFAGHRRRMTFVDGHICTLDFAPLLAESPGLAALLDEASFAKATVIAGEGWAVVWPEHDIQIGADTLWLDSAGSGLENLLFESSRPQTPFRAGTSGRLSCPWRW
jgi:hypothetical protein